MSTIIIAPYSNQLPKGRNAKEYEYWKEVIDGLQGHRIIQIGISSHIPLVPEYLWDLRYPQLQALVRMSDTWISIDSFLQHLGWDVGKKGVCIFTRSDPNKFGHVENTNLLKDRKYLRPDQFGLWTDCAYLSEASIEPEKVIEAVRDICNFNYDES